MSNINHKLSYKLFPKFLLVIFVLLTSLFFNHNVLSYDTNISHPYITEKAVALFNKNSQTQITQEEKQWIIKGAVDEDLSFRYMNHFYNPTTGKGLRFLGVQYESAKKWATDQNKQSENKIRDQTWQMAIYSYVRNDKKEAFIALGHLLHLIEDMAVPAHTRDDAHPEGDPYENWARDFGNVNMVDINTAEPFVFDKIGDFFDKLAGYSNGFLSNGSFSVGEIRNLNLEEVAFKESDEKFKLYGIKKDIDGNFFKFVRIEKLSFNTRRYSMDPYVHSSYHDLLAPKAVSYGAGLIDLFLKEAEKEIERIKKEKEYDENFWDRIRGFLNKDVPPITMLASLGGLSEDINIPAQNENDGNNIVGGFQSIAGADDASIDYFVPSDDIVSVPIDNLDNFTTNNPGVETVQSNEVIIQSQSQQVVLGIVYPRYSILSNIGPGGGGGGGNSPTPQEEIEIIESEEIELILGCTDELADNYNHEATEDDASCVYPDLIAPDSPVIISPTNFLETFASSTIDFIGTAEASSTISAVYLLGGATTTVATSTINGNWNLSLNFDEASTTVSFFATDISGNVSISTDINIGVLLPVYPPIIISPSDFSAPFASTSVVFSGFASSSLVVLNDFSEATTTSDTDGNWTLVLDGLSQGTTTINFFTKKIINSNEFLSNGVGVDVFVNIEPPEFNYFSIFQCEHSLTSEICLSASDTIDLSWSVVNSPTDFSYYSILVDGDEMSTTTDNSSQLVIPSDSYVLSIVAHNFSSSIATSTEKLVEIFPMPIIINEIAWAGTAASSNDEWIELYNRTDYEIDLTNIVLSSEDSRPYIQLSGTISPGEYYLMERADDNTISDISADLIYGNGGSSWSLNNTGEVLGLYHAIEGNSTTTIDITPSLSDCGDEWCAGSNKSEDSEESSMERIYFDVFGSDSSNWGSNNLFEVNGFDAGGDFINGTPKEHNSVSGCSSDCILISV